MREGGKGKEKKKGIRDEDTQLLILKPYEYCVGLCPLSEVYLIYTTFRELVLLPSSGYLLSLN
jgi:hypothetical protein